MPTMKAGDDMASPASYAFVDLVGNTLEFDPSNGPPCIWFQSACRHLKEA